MKTNKELLVCAKCGAHLIGRTRSLMIGLFERHRLNKDIEPAVAMIVNGILQEEHVWAFGGYCLDRDAACAELDDAIKDIERGLIAHRDAIDLKVSFSIGDLTEYKIDDVQSIDAVFDDSLPQSSFYGLSHQGY